MRRENTKRTRRIIAIMTCIVLLSVSIFSISFAASDITFDITYARLFSQVYGSLNLSDEEDATRLRATAATVWKITDAIAGFEIFGDEWAIYGEADMQTGLITHILCKVPYTKAGTIMTYTILFAISGESTADTFMSKYIDEEGSMKEDAIFPAYELTIDTGDDNYIIFEFERTFPAMLSNESNICPMMSYIEQMQ